MEAQEGFLSNIPRLINDEDNTKLAGKVTEAKVLEALQQMDLDKAPSLDGFSTHFYIISWPIIKADLVRMIL